MTLPKEAGVAGRPRTAHGRAPRRRSRSRSRTCASRRRRSTGQNAFIQRIFLQHARSPRSQSQLALYESDGTPKLLAMGVRERSLPVRQPALRPRRTRPAGRDGAARLPAGADDEAADDQPRQRPARTGRLDRLEGQSADGPRHGQPRLAAPVRPRPRADARQLRRLRPAAQPSRPCSITWPSPSSTTAGR